MKSSAREWVRRFRLCLRLIATARRVECKSLPDFFHPTVANLVHRFEESIAGHPYQIEVAAVSKERWRAYLIRTPGVPTALMPFYGRTPDEAADKLRYWLRRAHNRVASGARRA
ncbi:MAG: hypothetical protein DMF90_10690 [Acidobacteria bacterium]|nr:MAG: hypothetical protein DMF90_10690 [Acidobacteriota bacterium]